MINKISKRKMESYKRAEMVCQELRHQIASNRDDMGKVLKHLSRWMKVTGNIKFNRPKEIKKQ